MTFQAIPAPKLTGLLAATARSEEEVSQRAPVAVMVIAIACLQRKGGMNLLDPSSDDGPDP